MAQLSTTQVKENHHGYNQNRYDSRNREAQNDENDEHTAMHCGADPALGIHERTPDIEPYMLCSDKIAAAASKLNLTNVPELFNKDHCKFEKYLKESLSFDAKIVKAFKRKIEYEIDGLQGRVLYQCVLEQVGRVRRNTLSKKQTRLEALPIAMLKPERSNISTSFG